MQNPQHAIHDSHAVITIKKKSVQIKKAKSEGVAPIFGSGSQQKKKTIQGIEKTGHPMQKNQTEY